MKKKFNRIFSISLIISIVFLFVGFLLVLEPSATLTVVSYSLGLLLLLPGVLSLVRFFLTKGTDLSLYDCGYGIITIVAGLVIIFNPRIIVSIIPVVLSIWLIINSLIKMKYALSLKETENSRIITFTIAIVILIGAIVLLFNPFKGAIVMTLLVGIYMIVYGILDIIDLVVLKKNSNVLIDYLEKKVS